MCYYCKKYHKNARRHNGLNCLRRGNKYSAHQGTGLANHYCRRCKKKTHHFWHANSGAEKPWLRCNECT